MDKMGNADKFNGSMAISSSSSSFLNSDGVEHFSSTTARMGPGGIAEFQRQVRDGRTGEETIVMERRLGDQARIVEKMRNVRTGDEVTTQSNVGIQEGMEDRFDEEWQRAAQAIGGPAPREPRLRRLVRSAVSAGDSDTARLSRAAEPRPPPPPHFTSPLSPPTYPAAAENVSRCPTELAFKPALRARGCLVLLG
eukprot:CAMPEP_0172208070 /NCGR_PEP_ID=MMETSP1050-20130122/34239_1 /TAXON_ID=233186 /ORGANISM="Cryptomonas curvata, Strain CCAP979/52" /LENGTH=194 /DNA_ID=CAMNT_0012887563 /DNA_START=215 /DNA_END=796 /DNA_ORIENTATION=-